MVRRLDKIEKEMGYCEIKLEKERRLRKQAVYLRVDLEALERVLRDLEAQAGRFAGFRGRAIGSVPVPQIADLACMPATQGELGELRRRFVTQGVFELLRDERDLLQSELEGVEERLKSFEAFLNKQLGLIEEKRVALRGLSAEGDSQMRRLNDDFRRVESRWNSLAEDVINFDEALFFLEGNVDYLRSARTFLVSARASFDIPSWLEVGYLTDLVRHSEVGRAKEMIEGADRNVKLAEKELVCLANVRVPTEDLRRVMVPFFSALFDDLFIRRRLEATVSLLEKAVRNNEEVLKKARERRERIEKEKTQIEEEREKKFSEMGAVRRRFVYR